LKTHILHSLTYKLVLVIERLTNDMIFVQNTQIGIIVHAVVIKPWLVRNAFPQNELYCFTQEEEHKHPISYGELYNKVHKRKDGQYLSSKAKKFIVSMCLFYKY